MVARVSGTDEYLLSISTLALLGIIYLAIAVSGLRERIARVEGLLQGQRDKEESRDPRPPRR